MGLSNIVRRMHLRQKLSIRETARLTGVSRNAVTKHLAANTIEPRFATPERKAGSTGEQAALMPLPVVHDGFVELGRRVLPSP